MRPLLLLLTWLTASTLLAADPLDDLLPFRGLCLAAPRPAQVERFVRFIHEELAPRTVNTSSSGWITATSTPAAPNSPGWTAFPSTA
jgi:hypothetical protein